jgi:hypothetical protein
VSVDLYWIPLGAGGSSVRFNGRVYEAAVAFAERRARYDLYHSALVVDVPEARYVIEMTPVPDGDGAARGVVAEGPVGTRLLSRLRVFRYEVRRWPGGSIPDIGYAVDSPVRVFDDLARSRELLALVPSVPTLVWGRDELRTGEMWNCNSITSWLLARAGADVECIPLPQGGRAPGWGAGLLAAGRGTTRADPATVAARC